MINMKFMWSNCHYPKGRLGYMLVRFYVLCLICCFVYWQVWILS